MRSINKRQRAPGGGRKSALTLYGEPLERHTITLLTSHTEYLKEFDPNLSKAIRKLIDSDPRRAGRPAAKAAKETK